MTDESPVQTRKRIDAVLAALPTSWGTGGLEIAFIRDAVENNELSEAVYMLCSLSESLNDYGSMKGEIVALATEMGEIDLMPRAVLPPFEIIG